VCNQRCLFCHDRVVQDGSVLPLEEVLQDLALGRQRRIKRVVLSGGEPTLHPNFVEIVGRSRQMGYTHIQVVTNGRRFCYPGFLDAAVSAGLKEITFSLHGHTPDLHDAQTRTPGSFVQAIAGLKNALSRGGLIVTVDVVISRMNLPQLREILEHFIRMGVREFDLLWLVPFGDAWENRQALFCDMGSEDGWRHLSRALELAREPGIRLWTNRLPPPLLEGFEHLIQAPEKLYDEVQGRSEFFRKWIDSGIPMECQGERCAFCFIRDFCRDVEKLLEKGALEPGRAPPCRPDLRPTGLPPFQNIDGLALEHLVRFYIDYRYSVKAGACRRCARAPDCEGLPIEHVRRHGFPGAPFEASVAASSHV